MQNQQGQTGNKAFHQTWVSASEIGQHSYCARSAWLSRVKKATQDSSSQKRLKKGIRAHKIHGDKIATSVILGRVVKVFSLLTLAIFIIYLLLTSISK